MKKILVLLLVIGWITNSDEIIKAHVVSVSNGNTIQVKSPDNRVREVTLSGIECPALSQQYGSEAKKYLEGLILKKEVTVQFNGTDKDGKQLAIITTQDGSDVRAELLKEGFAWTTGKNLSANLEAYKTWAQKKEKGLWKENGSTPSPYNEHLSLSKKDK